jgi:hypothetical protein
LLVLAKPKLVARLLASDFPSENPRTQTRNFPYTTTLYTIMRNFYLPVLVLFSVQLFSQDPEAIELQKRYIKEAKKNLYNNNLFGAFCSYHYAYEMIPESYHGKKAIILSDSLRTILRNELKAKLEGIWKIQVFGRIKSDDDRAHYTRLGKFLKITTDSITFFEKKKDLKSNNYLSNQETEFCNLDTAYPLYNEIVHRNKIIWQYMVEKNGEVLKIMESGELFSNGSRSEIVSHPSGYNYKRIK